jgi:hypothetical protein
MARRDDSAVFDDVEARLEATGQFAEIFRGASPDQAELSSDRRAGVWFQRTRWTLRDEVDPQQGVHDGQYTLWIGYRDDDDKTIEDKLIQLENVVKNALDGQSLAGFCMPAYSRVSNGQIDNRARFPELRWSYTCRFSYAIDGYAGHDATDF